MAVRLGFRQVRALANIHGAAIVAARGPAPYESVEEVWRRARAPRAAIERLAEADAFRVIAEHRRQGLWKVRGLGEAPLPLFAAADERERSEERRVGRECLRTCRSGWSRYDKQKTTSKE